MGKPLLTGLRVVLLVALALAAVTSLFTHTTNSGGSPSGFGRKVSVSTSPGSQLHQDTGFRSGIVGNVSIVNMLLMCAVQFYPNGTLLPLPKVNTKLAISDSSGDKILVPVSWYEIANCGSVFGSFRINLLPGRYFVTLSYCSENPPGLGCDQLPVMVSVGHEGMTHVILDITYGWIANGTSSTTVNLGSIVTLEVFPPDT